MIGRRLLTPVLLSSLLVLSACDDSDDESGDTHGSSLGYYSDWPVIQSKISRDEAIEAEVAAILAQMTLEEKVGQMVQPNLDQVTPEEAQQYKLGSLLNGGGSWPDNNKHASAADWVSKADAYWHALENAYEGRGFRIPFMWATDAVHGHNNVYGATVFPHNIGLGATNDPDLIYRIGQATAKEVAATGLDWTFAPTVAAPRDDRWGRTYEGYSEDPAIIYSYAGKMVEGLQGDADGLKTDTKVISNVKHWLGDGGTLRGVDQGETHYSEEYLMNLHAAGYFSGLEAGAQVVMSSFNSWHNDANYDQTGAGDYNKKIHGSKYLITDVLKGKMGFDGLVVTDWNGHGQINGCTNANCPQAVNAGNDIFMVPSRNDWQAFYTNVIAQVNDGTIAMARIDDAVTRILRVKMRAGLWGKAKPSDRTLAGDQNNLGTAAHRALAREAVSKSLVLLKNEGNVLPLSAGQKVYLAGSAADNLEKQNGGWSLTWQGTGNTIEDFPGATTLKMALEAQLGADNVITDLSMADADTVAIIAIGEDAYAEGQGNIGDSKTLGFADLKSSYAADSAAIKETKNAGLKVVTVFFSGRPLYVNDEINHSDAFISAWLPGTEAGGITDVLYSVDGADFTGRLSYSWPNTLCSTTINKEADHISGYLTPETEQSILGEHTPLFAYGYGMSYGDESDVMLNSLSVDSREYGCGQSAPTTEVATTTLTAYGQGSTGEFEFIAMGAANQWGEMIVTSAPVDQGDVLVTPIDRDIQYDAANVRFKGDGTGAAASQVFLQYVDSTFSTDQTAHMNAESTLQFDIRVKAAPDSDFILGQHTVYPKRSEFKFNDFLPEVSDQWSTLKIPLACFPDHSVDESNPYDISTFNTPILFFTTGQAEFDLSRVRIVPKSIDAATDAISCDDLSGEVKAPLDENPSYIFGNPTWDANLSIWTAQTATDWSPSEGLITLSSDDAGNATEISVEYSADKPDSDKGVVIVNSTLQNLSGYVDGGSLKFDLFVEDYANNTLGLVIKMEAASTGPDIPVGSSTELPAGQWHNISIPVANLGLTEGQIQEIVKPFVILPAWDNPQTGVKFKFRNVRLEK